MLVSALVLQTFTSKSPGRWWTPVSHHQSLQSVIMDWYSKNTNSTMSIRIIIFYIIIVIIIHHQQHHHEIFTTTIINIIIINSTIIIPMIMSLNTSSLLLINIRPLSWAPQIPNGLQIPNLRRKVRFKMSNATLKVIHWNLSNFQRWKLLSYIDKRRDGWR